MNSGHRIEAIRLLDTTSKLGPTTSNFSPATREPLINSPEPGN